MKKLILIGVVLCLAAVMAAPAIALDTKFSGQFFVKGFHNTNYELNDNDSSDSYMTMRLRVQTDFYVSDNLNLTTRFDALDHKRWGASDEPPNAGNDNIDFDRAYMTVKGDFGLFNFGRMSGGTWGTLFNDTEGERDRAKFVKSFGDLTMIAIYEKNHEGDEGNLVSDQDNDIYYLAGFYKMENITAGLLYGFVDYQSDAHIDKNYHVFIPYFISKFGPVGIQGELRYNGLGEYDYDASTGLKDRDVDQLAWNLEGTYSMDMFKFELGYAFMSGQDPDHNGDGDDIEGYTGGFGDDWEKMWILTGSTDDNLAASLGGEGNLSATGGGIGNRGASMFYGGATVMPMENVSVKFLVAYAEADEVASNVDEDYGWEYDLVLNWKIFDNLNYTFIAAYLDAGDFWDDSDRAGAIPSSDLDDTLSLYQALTMTF